MQRTKPRTCEPGNANAGRQRVYNLFAVLARIGNINGRTIFVIDGNASFRRPSRSWVIKALPLKTHRKGSGLPARPVARMWLGYAMKDSSPAYLPSCVVEVMSWTANLREVASPQTVFHGLTTELYLGND